MSKEKKLRTAVNEKLAIDSITLLSMNDKLHTLERLLASPLNKIEEIAQDSTLPYFYKGCAKMRGGTYFVLKSGYIKLDSLFSYSDVGLNTKP